jgi:methionyl-tRNA formyltransferase
MNKLKTVFFGTPDFSVPSLEVLYNHPQIELSYVISMPDRPAGRGHQMKSPEVIEFAKKNKIPFFQTDNINKEEEFLTKLESENCDMFVVLAFAQFLTDKLLKMPNKGCFNIHTSLLPKYRGAAPIQYAILNGDSSTGVSIQKMVKKMDAGDIGWNQPVAISDNETGGLLYTRLKFQAALSLNEFIDNLLLDKISFSKQNEANVSFAPTLKREDGFLNFEETTYEEIKNRVRALYPWPGTYCQMGKKRLKVFSIEKSEYKVDPGKTLVKHKELFIGCKDSSIRLCEVQLEGKKRCTDTILLNGLKEEPIINP